MFLFWKSTFAFALLASVASIASAQVVGASSKIQIRGLVVDSIYNEGMIGAGVQLSSNKNIGALTDVDGKFQFQVVQDEISEKDSLIFTYLGYGQKAIPLRTRITRAASDTSLTEILVTPVKMSPDVISGSLIQRYICQPGKRPPIVPDKRLR